MKKFYCVQSRFFDDGKVKAICYPVEAEEKPQNTSQSTRTNDIYCDYFDTYDEAQKYLADCQKA